MKLITLLFLCSRLLLCLTEEAPSQELDCNDENLFHAADTALKKYNTKSQTGSQFVLYRITEATQIDGSDTFYSLKYEIKEGDCPVDKTRTWQDCNYKDAQKAATGECTATVGKRGNNKFLVAAQTCQITPAEGAAVTAQYECLGCVHPIPTDSEILKPALKHAVQHFNNNTDHSHLFALVEVKRAQSQVVAGWNFEFTYSIVQTNCSRKNYPLLTPNCKALSNGDVGECTNTAYVNPQLEIQTFSQSCDLYPGEDLVQPPTKKCAGCPRDIPVDDPELKEALTHSMAKLNAENNETFFFKVETVKRATVQVVAGKKFSIEFIARETSCSKESNTELNEACEAKKHGQSLNCNADVYVRPWEGKIHPTVNCRAVEMTTMMRRPPGFSPFRTVQEQETKEGTTVSPPSSSMVPVQEEQNPETEQGHSHGHGKAHKKQTKHEIDHGHKHKHDQSQWLPMGPKLDRDLKHQRGHDQTPKHKHGHGHGKHKNKDKTSERHTDRRTEHLVSSSEGSVMSSTQTPEKTEGQNPVPSPAGPVVEATSFGFQDSDLMEAVMPATPPFPTEIDDELIPDIQIQPDNLSFKLISDFPETSTPKCPGRPWKPVSGNDEVPEMKEFDDFDLLDAFF